MSGCGGDGGGDCGSNGCHQQPQQQQEQQQASFFSWVRRHGPSTGTTTTPEDTAAAAATATAATAAEQQQEQQPTPLCMKCKAAPSVTMLRQNEPHCHACIEAGIQQKCRIATKGMGLLSTGDRVLVALSGRAGSAGLLYCMAGMQAEPGSQRPERGKVAYTLTVLHIDCSSSSSSSSSCSDVAASGSKEGQQQQQQQELGGQLEALATAAGVRQQQQQQQPLVLLLHLSDIFCSDQQLQQRLSNQQQPQEQQRQQQLQELLSSVSDPTGREDLATHLRDTLLQRAAAVLGCNRLLRGECASRMAVRVIAEAAKGRGFSLPADIQGFDGRRLAAAAVGQAAAGGDAAGGSGDDGVGGVAVLQPLREVTYKELQELCSYKGIPLLLQHSSSGSSSNGGRLGAAAAGGVSSGSVNVLAERLVGEMESSIPISIYTIIRTAAHLDPFDFTDAAAFVPQAAHAMRKHRQTRPPSNTQQQHHQWQFCSICSAPLPATQQQQEQPQGDAAAGSSSTGVKGLCYSCNRQILQHVKLAPPAAAPAGVGVASPGPPQPPVPSLEQKMQRLKQLLPPGMLLESESDEEAEEN